MQLNILNSLKKNQIDGMVFRKNGGKMIAAEEKNARIMKVLQQG